TLIDNSSGFGPSLFQVINGTEAYQLPNTTLEIPAPESFCLPPIYELDISVPHFVLRRRNAIVEAVLETPLVF
ncbi:15236_t:CDS:1, partial [Funneliformis geosporum]